MTEENQTQRLIKQLLLLPTTEENQTQRLIKQLLLLPTFTYKHFSEGRKLEVAKVGVDLLDLHTCLNQFRESSPKQSESV